MRKKYTLKEPLEIGSKYGRLTCLGITKLYEKNGQNRLTKFKCDCGKDFYSRAAFVRNGKTQSCGCLGREMLAQNNKARTTHGKSRTKEYHAFAHARRRCTSPKDKAYPNYGGRGIEFRFNNVEEWLAELGPKPGPEYSVDRINNDGHYEPGNLRWATRSEQQSNQRRQKPYASSEDD